MDFVDLKALMELCRDNGVALCEYQGVKLVFDPGGVPEGELPEPEPEPEPEESTHPYADLFRDNLPKFNNE